MVRFIISCSFLFLFSVNSVFGQQAQTQQSLTLMFIGDVMGHDPQIKAAFDEETGHYNYDDVFARVSPIFKRADLTIANLEVTLAGPPYKGYPQFSSPDELLDGVLGAGVNVLVTANNHTVDRYKSGILRTIDVINSRGVPYAGAYKDSLHRDSIYPLILEQNGIRLALLNYTYGTNGIPVPHPTIVNLIDTALIRADYQKAQKLNVDEVIAFMHWGNEYERNPNITQLKLTRFMHELGIRIVIGSHPHVIQRMEASFDTDTTDGRVAVYSLGNFVSNQRPRYRNGGAVAALHIEKVNGKTRIANAGYALVWVHRPIVSGKRKYRVLPVAKYEKLASYFNESDQYLFDQFVSDSRQLLDVQNYNFPEIGIRNNRWVVPWIVHDELIPARIVPLKFKHRGVEIPPFILR
ncbi:MAG: CapA family protein [Tenuifilaceae bacterium]|jgi:poly-gamma-glutamate synthesis protein (capsule biosynthesis protein)|nr:CapA family protein [Tenuifilaceae bacterium]